MNARRGFDQELGQVDLLTHERRPLTGQLTQLAKRGAVVSFPNHEAPAILLGDRLRMDLRRFDRSTKAPKTRVATVYRRQDGALSRHYALAFGATPEEPAGSERNRRGAFRVRPDPAAPVQVAVSTPGWSGSFDLVDISTTGLSVLVDRRAEVATVNHSRVWISLELLGKNLRFRGVVHRRRLVSGRPCYGLAFDDLHSPGLERQQDAIARYVLRRQQRIAASIRSLRQPPETPPAHRGAAWASR